MTRIAILNKTKCKGGTKCPYACMAACPRVRTGEETIAIGPDKKPIIDESLCVGCGICVKRCSFDAIRIVNLPEQLKEPPIFRYGKNAFEIFRLPVPQSGQVVGLVGPNGIGKTTAIGLLAGLLRPNLGQTEQEVSERQIITHFRGTELQAYFTRLFSKKIRVSYKPQYIDKIPEKIKGRVKDLLLKFAGDEEVRRIASALNIQQILDHDLSTLSGGELQKVAIATAALKPADLYFFDEPASYLDVKERVRVAGLIRELAKAGKAVLVVEHDLIILDYLADLAHILFGLEGAYGVVSHPAAARAGINTYLAGFLRDENIRFRTERIKFIPSVAAKPEAEVVLTRWPALRKKIGTFVLDVCPSKLHLKEIVGAVGPNATGKTTFAQLLAGQLSPDKGNISKKLRIAYKPQYIKPAGVNVLDVLTKIRKDILSQKNKLEILRPLQIEPLLNKKLSELSGGELQRVAIAGCLARDADLFLLDEPSNYLDVEQRLQAAKTIQKVIRAREAAGLVIDHDLLFISYLADRLMVFEGEPAVCGQALAIMDVKAGLNHFLKELGITLRTDPESGRPRVNKLDSIKDREQRQKNQYYLP